MISIRERLLSGEENINDVLSDHIDLINNLYTQGIGDSLDEESSTEESHTTICTIIALCLLNDKEKIEYPLEYGEDISEDIIYEIAKDIDFILNLENMVDKGVIVREKVNGRSVYTNKNGEKKGKKRK